MTRLFIFTFSILIGITLSLNAQKKNEVVFEKPEIPVDELSKKITYTKVVEATGSKDELYRKALSWYNNYYKNPTEVIREKDPVEGKILGKGRIKILNTDGTINPDPFLDIASLVSSGSEKGLLGLAFHPNYTNILGTRDKRSQGRFGQLSKLPYCTIPN